MMKQSVIFLLVFAFISYAAASFAEEKITLSTFYPAPYGDYDELTAIEFAANKAVIGPTYPFPTNDGDLLVEGNVGIGTDTPQARLEVNDSIRFTPRAGDPTTTWPAGSTGEVAYSNTEDALYHYNGSSWVGAGGGGSPADWDCAREFLLSNNGGGSVLCSDGRKLITGGCRYYGAGGVGALKVNAPSVAGNGWECQEGTFTTQVGIVAWCCK